METNDPNDFITLLFLLGHPIVHLKAVTIVPESREVLDGSDVLLTYCDEKTILICGGPLKNVAKAIQTGRFKLGRLVVQGGFAGDNIVP
ncbi:unnamed protein product, partial [Rotaria sp. Silwood1]